MQIEFVYGPKVGSKEHVSRDVGAALTAGGFAIEIAQQPDPVRTPPPQPAKGWKVVRNEYSSSGYAIAYDDGCGARMLCNTAEAALQKRKVWHYDPATGEEGYILEDSTCPVDVIRLFEQMTGQVVAAENNRRQEIERVKRAMAR